jgi:opacity protein-like surface antigen
MPEQIPLTEPACIGPAYPRKSLMKRPILTPTVARFLGALALAAGLGSTAHAADAAPPADDAVGPYVGIGLGASKLGPRNEGKDGAHGDRPGVAKLYGGYRLTDTWGLEAGWAQLGRVHNDTTATDGSTVHHNGDAQSLYLAGTGRVALGHDFSPRKRGTPTSRWAGTRPRPCWASARNTRSTATSR